MKTTEETAPKKEITLTGKIPYIINISADGNWSIQYHSELEHDIAALAMAEFVMKNSVESSSFQAHKMSQAQKKDNGVIKSLKNIADKARAAVFGISLVRQKMQALYPVYKKYLADQEAKEKANKIGGGEAFSKEANVVLMPKRDETSEGN